MKQYALDCARRGWAVMPIKKGTKGEPHIKWAPYISKMPTEEQVEEWWTKWPDANIALICGKHSGIVVVDVDISRGGVEPDDETDLISRTGGGGFHWFYQYPPDAHIGNYVNIRPGVDIRAHGGYVILPPSIHLSGNPYQWLSEGKPAPCPQWVINGRETKKETVQDTDSWLSSFLVGKSEEGSRNDDLARFTGYLVKKGIPEDVALGMIANSLRRQKDPLPEHEVRTTVASVYRTASRNMSSTKMEWKKKEYVEDNNTKFRVTEMDAFMVKHGQSEMQWLVKGWIPDQTIAFLASPPGSFKTWLTFDIALSVASGKKFLGQFPVEKPGPVIMIQQEDFHGQVADRMAVIRLAKYGISNGARNEKDEFIIEVPPKMPNFFGIHEERALRFNDEEVVADFARLIAKVKPRLVIIDPLYYAVDGGNYMQDAVKDLDILKKLRDEFGTTFMLVHHTKKSAEDMGRQNMWGSQFLNAFLETGWQIRKVEGDESKAVVITRHFKAANAGPPQHVEFDIDTEAKTHHYKVVTRDATEDEMETAAAQKQKPASEKLDIYVEALTEHGECSNSELALHTGKNKSNVSRALGKLQSEGRVGKTPDGKWKALELEDF